ncbi:MAG: hypothetical protein ABL917_01670 [Parcubacteria group bacterium]
MESTNKKSPSVAIIVGILVVAVASYGAFMYTKKETVNDSLTTPAPTPIQNTTSSIYKDGVYTSVGEYVSPAGLEELGVEVTLKGGIISDAKVTKRATQSISAKMQDNFIGGYKTLVVGKKISEVNLSKVSGSSLTPKGFNDAIEKIKVQAKA